MTRPTPVSPRSADSGLQSIPRRPVAVIGGGVIGAACAHYLATAGVPVLLIEKQEFGKGCSHGNCGYVSPSHILPLCRPGAISATFKTFFQRNSPFKMRFRFDYQFWIWLWRFARKCNQLDMMQAGHARHALLQSSRVLYDNLMKRQVLDGCEWEENGLLFVHQSKSHFEKFAQTDELLRKEFDLGALPLNGTELVEKEPALLPGLGGAWLYECDAHLRSDRLMEAWHRCLIRDGVAIQENCELIRLEEADCGVSAIVTTHGRVEVDQVVIATGAWTRLLANQLKVSLPIEPGKGYSMTMRRPTICPKIPMILEDHRVAVTPFESGYRLGSTMEFAGYDKSLRMERLKLLTEGAAHYLREPTAEPVTERWYGWRPMSCDGVPIIGHLPRKKNLWIAAGHSMLGLSMAPGTGKLIAEMVTGKHPHIDPHPYRVDRF